MYQDKKTILTSSAEALFDSVFCGIMLIGITNNGRIVLERTNREAARIWGYTLQEFNENEGFTMRNLIYAGEIGYVENIVYAISMNKSKVPVEFRAVHKDGHLTWVMGAADYMGESQDERGHILWMQVTVMDIDDKKKAEAARDTLTAEINVERARYREALAEGASCCYLLDMTANEMLETIKGEQRQIRISRSRLDRKMLTEAYNRGERTIESDYLTDNGEKYYWQEIILSLDERSNHITALVIDRDYTETKKREEEHNRELAKQKAVIDALSRAFVADLVIDVETDTYEAMATPKRQGEAMVKESYTDLNRLVIHNLVAPEYQRTMLYFSKLSNLVESLKNTSIVSKECMTKMGGWMRVDYIAVSKNANGEVSKILFTLTEIDEDKKKQLNMQKRLESLNRVNKLAMGQSNGILAFKEKDGTTLLFNDEARRIFAAKGTRVTKKMYEMIHPEDRAIVSRAKMRLKQPGDEVKYRYRVCHDDSTVIYIRANTRLIELPNGERAIMTSIEDVTSEAKLNNMLRSERKQYREALRQDAVFLTGFDVTSGIISEPVTMKNGRDLIQMLGYTLPVKYDEMIDSYCAGGGLIFEGDATKEDIKTRSLLRDFYNGKTRVEYDVYDPTYRKYQRFSYLMSENDEGHVSAVFISQDITEQKEDSERRTRELEQAKEQMEQAYHEAKRANAAKSEFLSRMSHDIRTPMNGILGMSRIARSSLTNPERVEDALNKIDTAGAQLEALINDVLDMSRLESGRTELANEVFDIVEALTENAPSVREQAMEKGIHNRASHFEITNRLVIGSKMHMLRVISNIISNAIKYNKPYGEIELWLQEKRVDRKHSVFRFVIQDTGIGMSEEFVKHIFEPFSREHAGPESIYQGTGLGMAITKEIVELMGGTIKVESILGEGSTFTIEIPFELYEGTEMPKIEDVLGEAPNLNGVRLLLAEDNDLNVEIAQFMLERAGAVVEVAKDGKEAVDLFATHPIGYYDLILMDVMMPVLDGLGASRAIRRMEREDAKRIPIVAMTANAFVEDIRLAKEAGMNEHIAKPVDEKKMLHLIGMFVKK